MSSAGCAVVCRCLGLEVSVGGVGWANIGSFCAVFLTSSEVMGSSSSIFNSSSIMEGRGEEVLDAGFKSLR